MPTVLGLPASPSRSPVSPSWRLSLDVSRAVGVQMSMARYLSANPLLFALCCGSLGPPPLDESGLAAPPPVEDPMPRPRLSLYPGPSRPPWSDADETDPAPTDPAPALACLAPRRGPGSSPARRAALSKSLSLSPAARQASRLFSRVAAWASCISRPARGEEAGRGVGGSTAGDMGSHASLPSLPRLPASLPGLPAPPSDRRSGGDSAPARPLRPTPPSGWG